MNISPIATVHSCFGEKFGVPRQPMLADASRASIELLPPVNSPDAIAGIAEHTHLWIIFQFHQTNGQWSSKVRPPRLGGNKKLGVFATRSPFRPNNIGLSVVRLIEVRTSPRVELIIGGADLVDGTPVLDIKPYIPYVDAVSEACSAFADAPPPSLAVYIPEEIQKKATAYSDEWGTDLPLLIRQVLQQDPKPAYQTPDPERIYGMRLCGFNLRWRYTSGGIEVVSLS
ncbi:tRNA (N6-threonylcarbamoyladenosine(37)-N6)-methyltransferase TrmO [Microbulbifer thermotolerans]|uniref:tRNA (N6-threonylcarbamoyladenosine(37)-N6)-methyltransferase TrmO n=1 Tax=Microbulbifer thermotolerans TaxID=252514 RepID=UPI002248D8F8|nr:tRNA (N6-threonylcarbamoyladenosine(37)-N6)-methyltransferase TrmO [Microbulbifer thermotolerans]MCX2831467.1 tRNA (N6-threonylcarbamoyladenosine(37)-N6)-methyltransferase TrmO [Microbulbifer thermotolerans]WKT59643.1 tRNA (N6-threonylcarbamoyladenosine(37)-N6)-methyltransferase TrmO [Microbulbifer thermotolerans]